MEFFALSHISGDERLTILFNQYMYKLFMADSISFPRGSMSDYRLDIDNCHAEVIELHYELGLLSNALNSLRNAVVSSLNLLNEYVDDYHFDWVSYAIKNREKSLEEYGADEEDYDEKGEIIHSTDRAFLKPHSIYHELIYKGFDDETNSEMIGSSSAEDYYRFTYLVRKNTDFCAFKMLSSFGNNIPLTIYREGEDGEMKPISEIERIEKEINDDIHNENISDIFEQVLQKCLEAKSLFKSIDPLKDEVQAYTKLRKILSQIQDISFTL